MGRGGTVHRALYLIVAWLSERHAGELFFVVVPTSCAEGRRVTTEKRPLQMITVRRSNATSNFTRTKHHGFYLKNENRSITMPKATSPT